MATTTYGTEYVQSSDLVSNWPGSSLSVANRIDNVSLVGNGVNDQTGTSYTLALTDGGKLVTFSNAAAIALTVPTFASVAFPKGVRIKLTNKGAGTVTVAGAGGVTLNGNQLTIAQNRSAMLYKLDTNTWVMTADPSIPSDPGLAFITANTFTTSTAVNVNNCFTSTYANYRIVLNLTATSATDVSVSMYGRASGADTTTNYARCGYTHDFTTFAGFALSNAVILSGGTTYPDRTKLVMDVMDPQAAVRTLFFYQTSYVTNSGVGPVNTHGLMQQNSATQFDGFSLVPASGNISGTVRVYGYRNS